MTSIQSEVPEKNANPQIGDSHVHRENDYSQPRSLGNRPTVGKPRLALASCWSPVFKSGCKNWESTGSWSPKLLRCLSLSFVKLQRPEINLPWASGRGTESKHCEMCRSILFHSVPTKIYPVEERLNLI